MGEPASTITAAPARAAITSALRRPSTTSARWPHAGTAIVKAAEDMAVITPISTGEKPREDRMTATNGKKMPWAIPLATKTARMARMRPQWYGPGLGAGAHSRGPGVGAPPVDPGRAPSLDVTERTEVPGLLPVVVNRRGRPGLPREPPRPPRTRPRGR